MEEWTLVVAKETVLRSVLLALKLLIHLGLQIPNIGIVHELQVIDYFLLDFVVFYVGKPFHFLFNLLLTLFRILFSPKTFKESNCFTYR